MLHVQKAFNGRLHQKALHFFFITPSEQNTVGLKGSTEIQ